MQGTKVSGRKISRTERARRLGKMAAHMKESIRMAKNVDMVSTSRAMAMYTKDSGKITSSMGKEHSKWQMAESTKEIGHRAKCMAEDSTHGRKDSNIRVHIKIT